ncbi:glycosyltransferase family 2 protein [Streptomyces sp. NPDC058284]|uniref:glycosyltransferase family 2 protein n=1 Tax=unclassified Streptomyces TaxID=2593676 RepID=UPI00365A8E34
MISVVIPTRNRPALLQEALTSLAGQTEQDFEAVVVNDGGHNLTSTLRPWQRRLNLTLVELPEHGGVSRARNEGVNRASGEYVAFLDDDDLFTPTHLETAHKALVSEPVDFVYLGALVSGQRLSGLPDDMSGATLKAYDFDDDFLLVANYIHTGSVVVRSFRGAGVRFDESLTHCEDWDMWLTLRRRLGYRVRFVDEVTSIYHQLHDSDGLVASAQLTVPSPFTVVRERLHAAWPTKDPRVLAFRNWMTACEDRRNHNIKNDIPIPHHLFDAILRDLHSWFTEGREPNHRLIPRYFQEPA